MSAVLNCLIKERIASLFLQQMETSEQPFGSEHTFSSRGPGVEGFTTQPDIFSFMLVIALSILEKAKRGAEKL